MWQSMPRTRWRHALAFGLPLGVLQLVLYTFTVTHAKQLTYGPILLDYLLVFLISAVAGYHFCSHWRQKGWESVWAGLRAGWSRASSSSCSRRSTSGSRSLLLTTHRLHRQIPVYLILPASH